MTAAGRTRPSRFVPRTVLGRDAVLAAVLGVASCLLLLAATQTVASDLGVTFSPREIATITGLVLVQTLLLAVRRVRPWGCLLAVALMQVLIVAVLPSDVTVRLVAPVVAAYTVGLVLRSWPRVLIGVAAVAVGEVVLSAVVSTVAGPPLRAALFGSATEVSVPAGGTVISTVLVVVLYGAAAVFGLWVSARRENQTLVEARAAAEIEAERGRTQRAVEAERRRMARELHDIATHHLTGLVVQAAAVERLIERDPEAAREATQSLRTQGKDALANLRSVVGVLRETDDDHVSGGPTAGLDQIDDLVEEAQRVGDHVALTITGVRADVGPLAGTTAYRVVQEALTNARQHAPRQPVELHLAYAPEALQITVSNPLPLAAAPPTREGYGLVGMRERAQLAGGTLRAGPIGDAWTVRLTLPRDEPEDPT